MAVTLEDIDNITKALSNAEKTVRIDGKWVEYQSPTAMIAARAVLIQQYNDENAPEKPRSRITYITQRGRGL